MGTELKIFSDQGITSGIVMGGNNVFVFCGKKDSFSKNVFLIKIYKQCRVHPLCTQKDPQY